MKLKALLFLLALLFVLVAPTAFAQFYLDDPNVTPGDSSDKLMLSAIVVSATQNSVEFVSAGKTSGLFTLIVSACTACNITLRVEAPDASGTYFGYCNATAVTATGTTRHLVDSNPGATAASNLTLSCGRPLPPKFRVQVLWNSGTSASYTVSGVMW